MKKGFTLIELLIVIAIIGVLSSVVIAFLGQARAKARNARRVMEMKSFITALNLYYDQFGQYPNGVNNATCWGWDVSTDGGFVPALRTNGFLPSDLVDPSGASGCYGYFYYRYPVGNCGSTKAFYVLENRSMEGYSATNPYPSSPGWTVGACSWAADAAYVTGAYE